MFDSKFKDYFDEYHFSGRQTALPVNRPSDIFDKRYLKLAQIPTSWTPDACHAYAYNLPL